MRLNREPTPDEFKNAARGGLVALKLQIADMRAEIDATTFELEVLMSECESLIATMEGTIDEI
tara:strand:+ start:936 stop:1124 length:189 start_codon:yes stop_codon:yes gene_type:complete